MDIFRPTSKIFREGGGEKRIDKVKKKVVLDRRDCNMKFNERERMYRNCLIIFVYFIPRIEIT